MAGKLPSTITRDSVGSNTLIAATFTDIDDNDTWASSLVSIVSYWMNLTDSPTQVKEGCDIALSGSDFTFHCGEGNRTGILSVLCKM